MKKEKLIQYCEDHKIAVSKDATIDQLNAAIARTSLHKTEIDRDSNKSCFGFWEHENSICLTCDHENNCFKVVFGMIKEKYEKRLESLENPKLNFEGKMMKSKKVKL